MDMALISRDLSYFTSLYLFCVDSLMDIISEQIQMGIKGLSINFSNKISRRDSIKCSIDFAWNSFYNIPVKKWGAERLRVGRNTLTQNLIWIMPT